MKRGKEKAAPWVQVSPEHVEQCLPSVRSHLPIRTTENRAAGRRESGLTTVMIVMIVFMCRVNHDLWVRVRNWIRLYGSTAWGMWRRQC